MDDIEDINQSSVLESFTKDLVKYDFHSESDFQNKVTSLRPKYKLSPSKPSLRKVYHELLLKNEISPNNSFITYSLKRKCRSSSGVTVITILTSPFPKYTNSNGEEVIQPFSCGKNCAYCPDEPEIKLSLNIINVNTTNKSITVQTDDDIHLIRVLTYIIKDNIHYDVENCHLFKEDTFVIELLHNVDDFHINDKVIGFKMAQPRSYLSTEPAVLRANRNHFDATLQIYDRADALEACGHVVDKIEVLVLGGTWDHYPLDYQKEFIRDIYYSINTLKDRSGEKLSLEQEIHYNQTSKKRMIGLTLETRPDCVTLKQVKKLRSFNVTRLQIGVQHIDDEILQIIERGCTNNDTIQANHLWKQNGGKIDWHIMPDLPGSSIDKDMDMFRKLFAVNSLTEINKNHFVYNLKHPELQADQLKIYPCSVVDWTKIKEWYNNGTYKPYSENEEDLIRVIVYIKQNIFPWIRLNRIIRDIPNSNIIGGNKNVNLIGVEAAGEGLDSKHAATMSKGKPGVLHGSMSYLLQDENGQIEEAHSISAGLDYPGVGPEHSYLKDIEKAQYVSATDNEALSGFKLLSRLEGIIPALEPAHAIGYMESWVPTLSKNNVVLLLLSGRGDKDLETVANAFEEKI